MQSQKLVQPLDKKPKKLLFSLTSNDFEWDTFCAGGKGGMNQNAVASGVRCTHIPSGSVGTARDSRDQHRNRRNAFLRCVSSQKFTIWHKLECARLISVPAQLSKQEVESIVNKVVDEEMADCNLKVEYYND
jgi:protein subunit release factor B